jgi:hypothetical protein
MIIFQSEKKGNLSQICHMEEKREIAENKGLPFCKPFFKRFTKGFLEEKCWAVRDSNARTNWLKDIFQ